MLLPLLYLLHFEHCSFVYLSALAACCYLRRRLHQQIWQLQLFSAIQLFKIPFEASSFLFVLSFTLERVHGPDADPTKRKGRWVQSYRYDSKPLGILLCLLRHNRQMSCLLSHFDRTVSLEQNSELDSHHYLRNPHTWSMILSRPFRELSWCRLHDSRILLNPKALISYVDTC